MPREVLLSGSVPRQPAATVFETAYRHLGDLLRRIPDGEQGGWVWPAWSALGEQPAFEFVPYEGRWTDNPDSNFRDVPVLEWRLRPGASPDEVRLDEFGAAATVADSYRQFRELKDNGVLPSGLRLQATLAGPVTVVGPFGLTLADTLAVAERPIGGDVRAIAKTVPHDELTIQFDLAAELEVEEYRRNPTAFDVPVLGPQVDRWVDWTVETVAASVARLADQVPEDAELGFHLCGLWHIDPAGGQDIQVHVDYANALTEAVGRRIDYIHMASVPEHGPADYAKLTGLRLAPETRLFLGVLHSDGAEAAERRLRAASEFVPDVGVAHFCGLGPALGVQPEQLDEMLELHKRVASAV